MCLLLGLFVAGTVISAEILLRAQGRYLDVSRTVLPEETSPTTSTPASAPIPDPEDFPGPVPLLVSQQPMRDPEFGLKLKPSFENRSTLLANGKIIWEATEHIDAFGRRITPARHAAKTDEFIAVAGGSRVFGLGVEDQDTLPNFLQKKAPAYHVYNYGIPAAGPTLFLKMQLKGRLQSEIPEQRGVFVYVFDFRHESRVFGFPDTLCWTSGLPYYDLKNGELVETGTIANTKSAAGRWLYGLLSKSALYQQGVMFRVAPWNMMSADQEAILRRIFLKMKDEAARFNDSKFAMVFFESYGTDQMRYVWEPLQRAGIDVMIFRPPELPVQSDRSHYYDDGHPKPATYEIQAGLLERELRRRNLL